jgi:tRNA-dihydrouridine synthase
MSFLEELPKPFFILAPMDDVTDTVFRQIIAELAPAGYIISQNLLM